MRTRSHFPSRDALERSLQYDFSAHSTWPISYPAMTALLDMGLSDEKIARYFTVGLREVAALRGRYCLDVGSAPSS